MKISTKAFLLAFLANRPLNIDACPFSKTTDEMPSDSTHNRLRGRRLASLSQDDTTREKLAAIISKQKRSLQIDECVTNQIYENIRVALEGMTNVISDLGDRGHFIGGIVRLIPPFSNSMISWTLTSMLQISLVQMDAWNSHTLLTRGYQIYGATIPPIVLSRLCMMTSIQRQCLAQTFGLRQQTP